MIQLVCFDLNKTLIRENTWYDLNLALGMSSLEDEKYVQQYARGELSYRDWSRILEERYKQSGRASLALVTEVVSRYTYNVGAREIVEYLKNKGYRLALVSGAMDILVKQVAKELGIEFFEANNRFIFNEVGEFESIVTFDDDGVAKLTYLQNICEKLDIPISNCACVGDGDNDRELFEATAKGITFVGSSIESIAWKRINTLLDIKDIL